MPLDFPSSPITGATYTAPNGTIWVWDGAKWANGVYIGTAYAPINAPTFTGDARAVTPAAGDADTSVATTAFVANAIAPLATVASVPLASSTTPIMDGTAAVGAGTTFARADHVHASDTSRYAATNPAGYQTAAQVTASVANYLPLAGGSLSGPLAMPGTTSANLLTIAHASAAGVINVAGTSYDPQNGGVTEFSNAQAWLFNRIPNNGGVLTFAQAGTACGSIGVANATSTSFNTSSDARLKEDARSFDAGPMLDAVEVYDFAWKANGERAYGVMAQEAIKAFPDAITYEEATDWWGVDYSKYVPLLLAEIKALRARVTALEGKG